METKDESEAQGGPAGEGKLSGPAARADFLAKTDLFEGLDPEDRQAFAEAFELVQLPGGASIDCLVRGRDSLYIVVSGRVRATLLQPGGGYVVLELGRGKFCGELSLLGAGPRSASLFAVRDAELLAISHEDLERVAVAHPEALWKLARVVIARVSGLIGARGRTSSPVVSIACLPATDDPESNEAVAQFAEALAREGPTVRIDRHAVRNRFGDDGPSISWDDPRGPSVAAWLGALEQEHRYVVYQATSARDAWTLRCLRSADRIVIVAPAGTAPNLDAIRERFHMEDRCCISEVRLEALLYHPSDRRYPEGANDWKSEDAVARVHHARLGDRRHFSRIARCVTDRALGVVFGGGGARGVAQVGVLKALEEAGIEVDLIGGTSIGAIFAGGFGMGWSSDEIMERVRDVFAKRGALIDLTFPYLSLLSGAKLTDVLLRLFDSTEIENLWFEYFCVSVSLNEASINVHDRGPLWRHIRSSCALPGIFPPVHDGSDVLVDGGVMNNLPTDVMLERAAGGPVIAVDVSGATKPTGEPFGTAVSGWRSLASRLNPFSKKKDAAMHIFDVLLGSTVVSSRWKRNRGDYESECQLYLRPPVESYGVLQFDDYDELFKKGYEYTIRELEGWELERPE